MVPFMRRMNFLRSTQQVGLERSKRASVLSAEQQEFLECLPCLRSHRRRDGHWTTRLVRLMLNFHGVYSRRGC